MSEGRDRRETSPPEDRVEVWAKRTGRFLGFVALLFLALYLLFTYGPR